MKRYNQSLPIVQERREARTWAGDELKAGFGLIALAWMFLVFLPFIVLVTADWFDKRQGVRLMEPLLIGLSFGTAVLVIGGLYLLARKVNWERFLFAVETTFDVDLDGDGTVGKPSVSVEVVNPESNWMQYLDLPGTEKAWLQLAHSVTAGTRTLAEAEWTGGRGPFSLSEFRTARGIMMERRWIRWRNPRAPAQGVELTTIGKEALARLAEVLEPQDVGRQARGT